jgi:hypothetical protein
MEAKGKVTLNFGPDKNLDLPTVRRNDRPDVFDIRALYGKTGMFTYDPGFMSTASCQSKITYIDGDKGVLLYRGYPIEQLATHCDFLEVCYLLLNGELPKKAEKDKFDWTVTRHTMVHEQLARLYQGFRRDSHPMAVMVGVVGALSAFYHDSLDINNPEHREISAFRLIAKLPDHRRDGLQVQHGPAVHVPAQRPGLHGELHAHDVRRAGRGVPAERRADPRARPHLHPARRPRAERVDLDGAPGGLFGGRTRSRASPRASLACGARRTAAPTRRRCRC